MKPLRSILVTALLTASASEAWAEDRVRISHTPFLSSATLHVAIDGGFFEAEGITVEKVSMKNSNRLLYIQTTTITMANETEAVALVMMMMMMIVVDKNKKKTMKKIITMKIL